MALIDQSGAIFFPPTLASPTLYFHFISWCEITFWVITVAWPWCIFKLLDNYRGKRNKTYWFERKKCCSALIKISAQAHDFLSGSVPAWLPISFWCFPSTPPYLHTPFPVHPEISKPPPPAFVQMHRDILFILKESFPSLKEINWNKNTGFARSYPGAAL